MTNEELASARRLLLDRRKRFLARSEARLIAVGEELDTREIEQNENARELEDAVEATGLTLLERDRLAEIDAALLRVDQGTYGICAVCGKPIEPARLAAVPETTLCIEDAAAAAEQATAGR